TLSPVQARGTWAFGHGAEILVPVQGNLRADSGDALLAAAVGGQGIIYQPHFIVADALASGALMLLELDQPVLDLGGVHVLFPADRRRPAKVRAMIDYLVEAFSPALAPPPHAG
ncbi:LysR substrate-binding domain-containing protein, partial [Comamonas sp.]|uniref:LysR substrate-binding domain-containing protein n=1 Tax=Comamonas sp. TaxID=34028 RepID=UPI002FCA54E7